MRPPPRRPAAAPPAFMFRMVGALGKEFNKKELSLTDTDKEFSGDAFAPNTP
jgi:hypothetical protein